MATAAATRKQVKARLDQAGFGDDKFVTHKDGTFSVKRYYFYRHGMTPDKFAAKVKAVLPEAQIVETRDDFNYWPKNSYFVVRFSVVTSV